MTLGTRNIPPRETQSAAEPNMPGPVWGGNILSCLADCTGFQYILRISSSLRKRAFFSHWPSNHFVPFQVIFHLDSHYTEMYHTESALKRQTGWNRHFYTPKHALFYDKKRLFCCVWPKKCIYLKQWDDLLYAVWCSFFLSLTIYYFALVKKCLL